MTPRRLVLALACAALLLVAVVPWSARRVAGGPRVVFEPPREAAAEPEVEAEVEPAASPSRAAPAPASPSPDLAPAELPGPAPIAARTSILVLRLGDRAELLSWAEKPVRFLAPDLPHEARVRYRLEDARTGALLHEGPCDLPTPCRCAIGRDHADGCAVLRHDPVVRLKLPRLAGRERVTLVASGRTVGAFVLEAN
jgi:hypothetical protein